MIKVFWSDTVIPTIIGSQAHLLPIELEKDRFEKEYDITKCDIIPVVGGRGVNTKEQFEFIKEDYNNQLIVVFSIYHVDDHSDIKKVHDQIKQEWESYGCRVVIVHTNKKNTSYPFYDILWNRQKAYFTEYDKFDLRERVWTWGASAKMFELNPITKVKDPKHYLAPGRIYYHSMTHPRTIARIKLKEFLEQDAYKHKGYVSDPLNKNILSPQEPSCLMDNNNGFGAGLWWPVHNDYYEDSYFSVYVETITTNGETESITEKTWDPLIKGHFILPYAYPGIVQDLRDMGFKFPDWIDYGYDNILNDDERFEEFLKSLKDLLALSPMTLRSLYDKDKYILEHNRNMFWVKPYDSLYEKIVDIL